MKQLIQFVETTRTHIDRERARLLWIVFEMRMLSP